VTVPSYEFLGFAAIVAILINLSTAPKWRRLVFLVANVLFVASFTLDPRQLFPFAGMLALGFASIKFVQVRKSGAGFAALLVAFVALFCWLKSYAFIPHGWLLPFPYFVIGMSYVFFRVMHLIIDAFQDALPDRVDLLSYLNYTLNFTTLTSGPIQFYRDYRRAESDDLPSLSANDMLRGASRIVVGFFKVSIISPILSSAHASSVALLGGGLGPVDRAVDAAFMTAIFPVYLYYNFSGYTDFVIGVATFLRLTLPENFNNPFVAEGFIDFWGRWHITLATWVKTYIYNPIAISLMRRAPSRRSEGYISVIAYFVAFFFVGIWHGQTTSFVFLGFMLALGVSVNKLYQIVMIARLGRPRYRALCGSAVYAALSRGLTFTWFSVSSLWFWCTWPQVQAILASLTAPGAVLALVLLFASATVLLAALRALDVTVRTAGAPFLNSAIAKTAWYTFLCAMIVSATIVLQAPAPHIVYRGF
jgi:alginate O-acetyltransferase complex protein AlgI